MDTIEILSNMRSYIESKGFSFDFGIIESLFLALKSKPFAVLSGRSGSGKSSLARLFAESIGANCENGRYKQICPEADWQSSAGLLGFVNRDGKFVPGVITSYIQEAMSNPELPYILCIDEMNLSRPEQYMSGIISAIESRRFDSEGRIITDKLFCKSSFGIDLSASFGYDGVYIPDNFYIIGTVNADEASYPLTAKLIDRVFVIDLNSSNLALSFDFGDDAYKEKYASITTCEVTNDFLKSEYITSADLNMDLDFLREYSFFLQHINQYIKYSPSSLSYRSRDDILFYSFYARHYDVFDKDTLTDFIFLQKLLPRINGSGRYIKNALISLFKQGISKEVASMNEYSDNANQMNLTLKNHGSKYPRSSEKITLMMRRLEEYGFTSFWQ